MNILPDDLLLQNELLSGQEVRDRIANPRKSGGIEELPQCWTTTDISLLVHKKIRRSDLISLPSRIRGGWGNKLVEMASFAAQEGKTCNWRTACALSVFFNDNGAIDKGLQAPRPYVFELFPFWETEQLLINLKLFGFAGNWVAEASAALRLLMQDGVVWQEGSNHEKARTIDMSIIRQGPENLPNDQQKKMINTAFFEFVTPLSLRRQGNVTADVTVLPMSLANRLIGLARWHDFDLIIDRRELKFLAQKLRYDSRDMQAEGWFRYSKRQNRKIPMEGLSGSLVIEGDIAPFIPYFWLGQDCFVGSHSASGMGRYYLELVGEDEAID